VPNPNPEPPPDEEPALPKPPRPGPRVRRLRPAQPGGAPERWRLRYAKTGPAALLGHLDLIRELPRVIRRAGVRTAYTDGFHPKPDMSFGPALSLGVASLDEYLDIKLIDAPEPPVLIRRLNAFAAGGLRFLGAQRLAPGAASLGSTITGACYVVALAEDALVSLGGQPVLAERIASFLARSEARVMRKIDGIGKIVDVRRLVSDLRIGGASARATLAEAGVVGRALPLEVTIRISQAGSAKISELVEALLGDAKFPHVAVRREMILGSAAEAPSVALQLA
jgi:radical SAM-linked protein